MKAYHESMPGKHTSVHSSKSEVRSVPFLFASLCDPFWANSKTVLSNAEVPVKVLAEKFESKSSSQEVLKNFSHSRKSKC